MSSESPPARKPRAKARSKPREDAPVVTPGGRLADWALIAAFLALTFLLGVFPLKDTDFWWHLRTGDLIRQTGHVPQTDLYTFTVPDAPWIDLHWGFQVGISWLYARGGVVALNLTKCGVTCLAVFLLVTARRREWPVWAALLAWLPALLVLGGRMYVRPETLSLLYLSGFLAVLGRWDRFVGFALLLPVIQVCWVNTQGLFVLGPIVLTFGLIDAALRPGSFGPGRKRWWRVVGLATALTGLACLVNPYGVRGALYPLQLAQTMRNPIFSNTIAELTPIPRFIHEAGLANLPLQLHLATMVLGALSFLVPLGWWLRTRLGKPPAGPLALEPPAGKAKRAKKVEAQAPRAAYRPLSPLRLLLFVAFSLLSVQATRNSHQFAAVVGTVTAWNCGEWAAAVRARRLAADPALPRLDSALRFLSFLGIAGVFGLVASGAFYGLTGEGRTIGLGEQPLWYPHDAVRFAGGPGMPARFLSYHNGHASLYEYYHGPERKVFADARLEVIGPELYERYLELGRRIETNDPTWARELDELQRPAVLADHAHSAAVGAVLLGSPRWRCVWFDPVALLFVHDSNTEVVRAHTVDFGARHFRPEPADGPQGTAALLASAKALALYADAMQAFGRPDLARPLVLLGLDHGRRVRQADPRGRDGWKVIGQLEGAREPRPRTAVPRYRLPLDPIFDLASLRATYALRRALDAAPDDFLTLHMLADLYEQDRGMHEAALPLLDRLVLLRPINRLQAKTQNARAVERTRLRANLGPEPPASWANLSELDQIVSGLLRAGRARSAAEVLERAYPAEPRPREVTDRLATLWLHLGDPERARAFWAGASDPPQPAVRAARVALTHLVEDDRDAARQGYQEALAADPNLFEAHYGLAVLEQDAGRAAEALAEARKAIKTAPSEVARAAATTIAAEVAPYVEPIRQASRAGS